MLEVADGLWQIQLVPKHGINAYLMGDVIVDAGIARSGRRIVQQLEGRPLTAHAITHAHPDHVGGSEHVTKAYKIPCWAGANDADAVQSGIPVAPPNSRLKRMVERKSWNGVPVQRRLVEGDVVAGFTVLDAPGHSPGHIVFWREADRVLVAGDVFFNLQFPSLRPGLREPFKLPTVDPARNRESMRRLAALQPATVVFGHGPPLTDAAPRLRAFVATL
jgi:glyoxylase-like metal-dependent hydrolase (beta-lactamase superfamily II)